MDGKRLDALDGVCYLLSQFNGTIASLEEGLEKKKTDNGDWPIEAVTIKMEIVK